MKNISQKAEFGDKEGEKTNKVKKKISLETRPAV